MKTATGTTVITNGTLVDGTGAAPVPDAAVVVRDGRITYAGPCGRATSRPTRRRSTPAAARSCRAWSRPTSTRRTSTSPRSKTSTSSTRSRYVTLLAAPNTRLALECGYTAARSGGSLFNIDVWLKKAIEDDLVPGPRLAPSGREICGVGGLMDWNPDYRKIGMEGLILVINGPDEARSAVRKLVKDGASGSRPTRPATPPPRTRTTTTRSA